PQRLLLQPSGADPNLLGDGGPHDLALLSIIQSVRFQAASSHLRCAATAWRELEQVGSEELLERYVKPSGRSVPVSEVERIVYAEKL
ncbi:MAG TPA: hypothetical protein VEU50_26950, partial [Archangium sp.]